MNNRLSLILILTMSALVSFNNAYESDDIPDVSFGKIERFENFKSEYVTSPLIEVCNFDLIH